jgi:PPM family protein phosphatase
MNLTNILEIVRLTDIGQLRKENEDTIASDAEIGLVVLADGMGGYNAGKVASEIAVLTIVAELKERMQHFKLGQIEQESGMQAEVQLLRKAVIEANLAIYNVSCRQRQCAGMGTTLVTALFTNDHVLVGHVGDSRMYRLREHRLTLLTEDHSLLQEQVRSGLITPEQARQSPNKNLITRALGIAPEIELELHEYSVQPEDLFLLCSDGLSDLVEDIDIQSVLDSLTTKLDLAAQKLVEMANNNGGKDNISVILVRSLQPFPVTTWYQNAVNWLKRNGQWKSLFFAWQEKHSQRSTFNIIVKSVF